MQSQVKKWGNSASVRIPSALMEAAGLSVDHVIDIREEGGCIIIEPVRPPAQEYTIETLIAGITPDNLHDDIDTGAPVGVEFW